jgi:hypothetical protein
MRALVLALVFLFSGAAAAEYKLQIDEGKVVHNPAEWLIAGAEAGYRLYVHTSSIGTNERYVITYTAVEFDDPKGRKMISEGFPNVKRIYTAGIMECPNEVFNLMDDYFVDVDNKIIYVRLHESGESLVEVRTPLTARRAVYEKVCNR